MTRDLSMTQAEHDAAFGIICYALARRDGCLEGCNTTLPMHHWLCDHGMAPGVNSDTGAPLYSVWDRDLAMRTVGAMPLRRARQ